MPKSLSLRELSLQKLALHVSPRRPGTRGEPGLRRFVLLANVCRSNIERQESLYDLFDSSDEEIDDDDEVWGESEWLSDVLEELISEEEELPDYDSREVVLYRQVPESIDDDGKSSEEEEGLEASLNFGWDSLPVCVLKVEQGDDWVSPSLESL